MFVLFALYFFNLFLISHANHALRFL